VLGKTIARLVRFFLVAASSRLDLRNAPVKSGLDSGLHRNSRSAIAAFAKHTKTDISLFRQHGRRSSILSRVYSGL
jgi:hypothetical protein